MKAYSQPPDWEAAMMLGQSRLPSPISANTAWPSRKAMSLKWMMGIRPAVAFSQAVGLPPPAWIQ